MNRSSKQLGPLSLRRLRLPTPPVTGKLHHIVFEFHFFLLGSIFYSLPSCYNRFQRRLLVSPLPKHPARHPQALVARKRIHSRQDTRPSVSASILTTIQHRQAGLHAGFQLSGLSFPVRRTFFQRVSSATENRGPPPFPPLPITCFESPCKTSLLIIFQCSWVAFESRLLQAPALPAQRTSSHSATRT